MPQTSVERQVESTPDATLAKPPQPADRDAFFDNAKFFAILLVVVGHASSPLREHLRLAGAEYMWIYIFHMPAFILIAGYFTKNFNASGRKIQRLVAGIAVPYLIWEVIYTLQLFWTEPDDPPNWSLLSSVWLNWFLAALFIWRLTSPIWRYIRWPLAVSVVVSLAAGLSEFGYTLDMARVLQLLPFFVLGMVLRREHFAWLHRPRVRIAAVLVLVVSALTVLLFFYDASAEWVYWRRTLAFRDVDLVYGTIVRAGMLLGTTVITAAFLSVIPVNKHWFTALGSGTIYAYLLHGLFVRTAEYLGFYDHLDSYLGMAIVTACSVGLAIGLMTPPVQRITHWAVEPRMNWLFRNAKT